MISIISAIAKNRVIGSSNKLPWHLPADFKWFKEKTLNKTIVMGLNTFKSIGEKPLPNRKNIVLTNDASYQVPDHCHLARSIDEVLKMVKPEEELMVCGGSSVYGQFLGFAEKMYLTMIDHSFQGDAYFPEFDMGEWEERYREDHVPDLKNQYPYSFLILERKKKA